MADPGRPKPVLVSWSSGKDSAWALHVLRLNPGEYEVRGVFTTVTPEFDRVSIQATPRAVLRRQAERLKLPLYEIPIPYPCSNEEYEAAMGAFLERARDLPPNLAARTLAFGDLFLEDIRAYREDRLRGTGFEPIFPLFGMDTAELAETMIAAGLSAFVTALDARRLDAAFAGRRFDRQFLADLPRDVDPLGENGEFHTCVVAGPMFSAPIEARPGRVVQREIMPSSKEERRGRPGYVYADVVLS